MRITRLETWPVSMPLSEPYTIAYETVTTARNVFVRLHTDTRHVGHGCAAPDAHVTGETPADVIGALEQVAGPALVGLDPMLAASVYDLMRQALHWRPWTWPSATSWDRTRGCRCGNCWAGRATGSPPA